MTKIRVSTSHEALTWLSQLPDLRFVYCIWPRVTWRPTISCKASVECSQSDRKCKIQRWTAKRSNWLSLASCYYRRSCIPCEETTGKYVCETFCSSMTLVYLRFLKHFAFQLNANNDIVRFRIEFQLRSLSLKAQVEFQHWTTGVFKAVQSTTSRLEIIMLRGC